MGHELPPVALPSFRYVSIGTRLWDGRQRQESSGIALRTWTLTNGFGDRYAIITPGPYIPLFIQKR